MREDDFLSRAEKVYVIALDVIGIIWYTIF
jgi:hypothetical protein